MISAAFAGVKAGKLPTRFDVVLLKGSSFRPSPRLVVVNPSAMSTFFTGVVSPNNSSKSSSFLIAAGGRSTAGGFPEATTESSKT